MEKINESQFKELVLFGTGLVVVDFFADWCNPCKMLGPILNEVSAELTDVSFYKVNVDEQSEIAQNYRVMSIPTIIIFKDGKPIEQSVGFAPKKTLIEWINSKK